MTKLQIFFSFFIISTLNNFVNCAPTTSTDASISTVSPEGGTKEEAEMKVVVKKISELAKQIIQLMGENKKIQNLLTKN